MTHDGSAGNASAQPSERIRWLPVGILVAGAIIRIVYACGCDVRNVHDDHFHVVRQMLETHRWPDPQDGWQTYQPPLYHLLGAFTYRLVAGEPMHPLSANARHEIARKAVQFLSLASGVGALILMWLSLRLLFPGKPNAQAAGMALAAFLPRHIYMSAMATNDAMTYMWASLCVYACLRAVRPAGPGRQPTAASDRPGWWVAAGIGAALAMRTKQYGLGSVAVPAALIPMTLLFGRPAARRRDVQGSLWAVGIGVAVGIWPYLRVYQKTGSFVPSNYTLVPNNMGDQLPGDLADVSFVSLRIARLLERPWNHADTIDSFWTNLYAGLWFDFDTSVTIFQYRPWWEYMLPIWSDRSVTGRQREQRQLIWDTNIVDSSLLWEGRFLILLGLLPTVLIVVGACSTWRRFGAQTASVLLASHAMGLAAPLIQTVRQPFRSSMKAAFILPALVALVVFFAVGVERVAEPRGGMLRWLIVGNLALLACVTICHFIDLGIVFPQSPGYLPRPDPL